MNHVYQSFNFRGRDQLKPYYDLLANIVAEELGHIELVAATINLLLAGSTEPDDPADAPLAPGVDRRNTPHFIATGQAALCADSMGGSWRGDHVFSGRRRTVGLRDSPRPLQTEPDAGGTTATRWTTADRSCALATQAPRAAFSGRFDATAVEDDAFVQTGCRVARVGPTTPKLADPMLLRSIRPKRATPI